jgi:hypothetical protein
MRRPDTNMKPAIKKPAIIKLNDHEADRSRSQRAS